MSTQRPEGLEEDQILYAGDTICIARTRAAMNTLIAAIEEEGANTDLNLIIKGVSFCMWVKMVQYFFKWKTYSETVVKYLGGNLNKQMWQKKYRCALQNARARVTS